MCTQLMLHASGKLALTLGRYRLQFHIKFLFILALHAFVSASVIGSPFTALLSSYPLYMFVYCIVLFVQSHFWAFFPMIIEY